MSDADGGAGGHRGAPSDLALAHALADVADEITMRRFRALDLRVSTKPDHTPVSDADTAVERAVRELIATHHPGAAVLGEEYGAVGTAEQRWVIDPIDGTKNFVRGVPVWATLLALRHGDDNVLGLVSAPALGRRWWAERGGGAWAGASYAAREPCHVSAVAGLTDAYLSYSSLGGWESTGRLDGFLELSRRVWRTRGLGDFWSHVLVAEGVVDLSCEPEVSLWDLAPLQVIVEEAGGTFSDLAGVRRADGGSVLCSNGLLHAEALALLR